MRAFSLHNPGFVGALTAAAPVVADPGGYGRYMSVEQTALHFPSMLGGAAPATIAMWLRPSVIPNQSQDFLIDNRPAGTGYFFDTTGGLVDISPTADGAAFTALNSLYTGTWHKVILESTQFLQPTLLALNGNALYVKCDIADLRFYRRAFTDAERADATGPFPALSAQDSRWDFRNATADVPDVSGNGKTLAYAGPGTPTFTGS